MKKTFWMFPLLLAVPLLAVTPIFWEVRTYDEFRKGKLQNLSLTSDGDLILAPRFDALFDTQQPLVWSAVLDSKGNIYLGTGHDGKVYKVDAAGQGTMIADLAELDVLALAVDKSDTLYAGTSPDGKVYKIAADGKPLEFFDPDAKYIWTIAIDSQGRLLVATGDKGIIYRVGIDGKGEVFYDSEETNVISLALDGQGNVIAGGDPKGYIYRIGSDGKAFVLYDSGMREVHAVAVGSQGKIYAAVLSGRPALSPAPGLPVTDAAPLGEPTVTVSVGGSTTQGLEVVEPLQQPVPEAPRPSGRGRGDSGMRSAILEIQPDATVNTIWRSRDEMVFALLPRGEKLLFSTGTKGRVYSIDGPRSTTLLVESTEEQTTGLLEAGGRIVATSANMGKVFRLADVLETSGSYESSVRDTEAISSWGKISWKAEHGNLIEMYTRTGNTSTPDRTWSDWARVREGDPVTSPRARFIQWKAYFKSLANQFPSLSSVTLPYLQQNFQPEITSIDVLPSGVSLVKVQTFGTGTGPAGPADVSLGQSTSGRPGQRPPRILPRRVNQRGAQSFQWQAEDRNEDSLVYDMFYRAENERAWKVLRKAVEDNFYTIDSNTLPDGTYVVRIVATDDPSNPSDLALQGDLESRTFSIDNTPPSVTMTQQRVEGRRVRISIDATDLTSTLKQSATSVDAGDWRLVFPRDGINDSRSESFEYLSDELSPGEHVIAFRIYDQNENVGMGKLVVRIP